MRCILTAMAARREYFDGAALEEGSTQLFNRAVKALRKRLCTSAAVNMKLVYSMMKLCHAEGYRHNFEAAIVHLHGAQAALEQMGSWKDLDLDMLSWSGESGRPHHHFTAW